MASIEATGMNARFISRTLKNHLMLRSRAKRGVSKHGSKQGARFRPSRRALRALLRVGGAASRMHYIPYKSALFRMVLRRMRIEATSTMTPSILMAPRPFRSASA